MKKIVKSLVIFRTKLHSVRPCDPRRGTLLKSPGELHATLGQPLPLLLGQLELALKAGIYCCSVHGKEVIVICEAKFRMDSR
jgi:hypothetical protein